MLFLFFRISNAVAPGMTERNLREEYLKPGFENNHSTNEKNTLCDRDLDGEIYAEQLHSLLQRISPEMAQLMPMMSTTQPADQPLIAAPQQPPRKASDEEKIWNAIHGNGRNDGGMPKSFFKHPMQTPHGGGVFEGAHQGPKTFFQSVTIQTVHKPDGSSETRRTIRGADGHINTTITRSKNGQTETITSNGNQMAVAPSAAIVADPMLRSIVAANRNVTVTKGGYLLPNNLWWLAIGTHSHSKSLNILILNIIINNILAVIISVLCVISKHSFDLNEFNHHIIITKLSWKLIRSIQFKQLIMFVLWFWYLNSVQRPVPDR